MVDCRHLKLDSTCSGHVIKKDEFSMTTPRVVAVLKIPFEVLLY